MLLFAILVALFLVMLAWASEIVGVFTGDETMVGSRPWASKGLECLRR